MAPSFKNSCMQHYYLQKYDLAKTYIYGGQCRVCLDIPLVSPFPTKTPQRSEKETLHLVLVRNQIPLELSYYIVNQYLYQTTDPMYHNQVIARCLQEEKTNMENYKKVLEYGKYVFGPRFMEEVDDIPFFSDWLFDDVFLPLDLEPSTENEDAFDYLMAIFRQDYEMRRHLVRHYSPTALQQVDPKTKKTILDYLFDVYLVDGYDVIEHCLAVMPLEFVLSFLQRNYK
jgi:hypothetical protein